MSVAADAVARKLNDRVSNNKSRGSISIHQLTTRKPKKKPAAAAPVPFQPGQRRRPSTMAAATRFLTHRNIVRLPTPDAVCACKWGPSPVRLPPPPSAKDPSGRKGPRGILCGRTERDAAGRPRHDQLGCSIDLLISATENLGRIGCGTSTTCLKNTPNPV